MTSEFFGIVHLPTYLIAAVIIILLPGPNSLYVLTVAAQQGVRRGYLGACGIFLGDTVLMLLASAGVASLLKLYPAWFTVFKCAGGAYLAWLGIKLMIAAWNGARGAEPADAGDAVPPAATDRRSPLLRAWVISLLNPKAILFIMAFFIQFVDPDYPHRTLSFALLGGMTQVISFLYLSTLIFSGARLAAAFRRRRRLRTALTGGAGAVFLGFGVKLATASVS
jgi:leucine efflux protein